MKYIAGDETERPNESWSVYANVRSLDPAADSHLDIFAFSTRAACAIALPET